MLISVVENAARLDRDVRREAYALFERYYRAISFEQFDNELSNKDTIFLLYDEAGRLRGFSTLSVFSMTFDDAPIRVVYSGDTIIEPAHWGSQAFAFSWIRHIGRIASEAPDAPLYWLLIVKGHRTYRYLPAFGIDFVPDWRKPADPSLDALKDAIAMRHFGAAYKRDAGIVRFDKSRGHLAAQWAKVSEREARRPDVQFFLERNPGYVRGDELVCLCQLDASNMRPLTCRLFLQGRSP